MSNESEARPGAIHPTDRQVGLRIRLRRREVGVTQGQLAEAIGVTFQQIQKYERASNRVSASKLWEIAQALGANVGYFYEGLADTPHPAGRGPAEAALQGLLLTPEGLELATSFPQIRLARVRRKIVELARALAEADPVEREAA